MQSSLEKLRKFFRLEAENKYANTAVIGGLAKILDFWEAEARNEGVPEDLVQLVAMRLRDYDRLTPTSRADTLKGVWKRIQNQTGETDIPSPVYTQEAPAQPPAAETAPAPASEVPAPTAGTAPPAARPEPRPAPAQAKRPAPPARPRPQGRREPKAAPRPPPPAPPTS